MNPLTSGYNVHIPAERQSYVTDAAQVIMGKAEEMKKLGYSQDRVLGMLGKAVLMGNHSAAVAEGLAKSLTVNINGKPVSLLSQPGIAKGIEALKDKEIKRAWQAESRSHTREEWARQRAVRNAMSAGTAYGSQNDDLTRETVVDKLHLCTDETYPEFVRNARAAAQGRYLKPENQIDLGRLKYGIITGTDGLAAVEEGIRTGRIRIQRITDKVTPAVDFRDGSTLALRPLYAAWPLLSLCAGKTLWPFLSHRTLWPNGDSGDIQGHLSGREIIFAATGRGGGLLHVDPHLAEVVDLDLCLGEYLFDFLEDLLRLVLRGDGGFPVEGVVGFRSCVTARSRSASVWAAGTTNILNDVPCVGLNGDSRYYGPAFLHGTWLPYTGSVMAIDPAGRGKDETAVCVVKMLNGYLYVTAMRAYQEGYSEATLSSIVQLAKQQAVNHVIIEANFGDGMFTKLISPYFTKTHPCRIEEVKHSKQKEARIIDTLEPVMNQHKLVIDKNLILWDYNLSTKNLPPETALKYQLMYQMSRITRDKGSLAHDDRLDSLAMAVGYWVEQMGQDVDKRMALRQDLLMLEELKAWEGNAKGGTGVKIGITNNPTLSEMIFTFHGTVVKTNDDTSRYPRKKSRNWMGDRGRRKGRKE